MEPTSVMEIITGVVTDLTADAFPVIAAGIGLSAVFFGAKFMWKKFKGITG